MGKHKKKREREETHDDDIPEESVHKKKKKKHRDHKEDSPAIVKKSIVEQEDHSSEGESLTEDALSKHRKKKKKLKKENNGEHCDRFNMPTTNNALSMESNKNKKADEITDHMVDEMPKKKKKKKKKRKHQHGKETERSIVSETTDGGIMDVSNISEKTAKKKKRKKEKECDAETEKQIEPEKMSKETESGANVTVKEKKKERKSKETKKEITIENASICERAEVIDDKSNVTNNSHVGDVQNACVQSANAAYAGQWNTATLGDADRQNKFLRLLGGFKKDGGSNTIKNKFQLGSKPPPNKGIAFTKAGELDNTFKKGGNVAMDKQQEEIYTKAMENEYDRAMSMNLNRGVGIGFQEPPEKGKKFYIDTKQTKSIKFDD